MIHIFRSHLAQTLIYGLWNYNALCGKADFRFNSADITVIQLEYSSASGLDYQEISMFISMLANKDFWTWLLIDYVKNPC